MRIAVVLEDKCSPDRCSYECINYCPRVRTGDETIVKTEDGIRISEQLCSGCGICVDKCPFDAIKIINVAEELDEDQVHRFGENGFRLYRLPVPQEGNVVGLLGANGIGKTTAIKILSGDITPNLGSYEEETTWDRVIEKYSGKALGDYFTSLSKGDITTSLKPQYVDDIPAKFSGTVGDLLEGVGGDTTRWIDRLEIREKLDSDLSTLSGGELQRTAIAAASAKEADIYFFDEPSSYLDIKQRLNVAKAIREKSEDSQVLVIEHDLAVLDFLADTVHILYGSRGAYGVVAHPKSVRKAINTYLKGFLEEENIRFRPEPIEFKVHSAPDRWHSTPIIEYDELLKRWDGFELHTEGGKIPEGEVIGIVGPNATGKTTFVKMLAGATDPTEGDIKKDITVSYKPQYIKPEYDGRVKDLYNTQIHDQFNTSFFNSEVIKPLNIEHLLEMQVKNLSGGELQRVVTALCMGRDADLYLIDEPSAYLDSSLRMDTAKTIKRFMEKSDKAAMIVDHDVYFIDFVSDLLMNFTGDPGKKGLGKGPHEMKKGMNLFLSDVDITFRRDPDSQRPRVNKPDSRLDRKQKSDNEYYYSG